MKKKIVSFLLVIVLIFTNIVTFNSEKSFAAYSVTNHQQTEEPWGSTYYDGYTFASSACGIMATVNAVHYLTGNWINPLELANWAHNNYFYTGTYGTERSMWGSLNASGFADTYGFTVSSTTYGTVYDTAFKNHIANGGVAVVHVYNHYMAIVDYNASTKKFLLWDNAAGPVCGYKRPTATNGNWCTADELEGGWNSTYLTIDWYCLLSKTGSTTTNTYTDYTNVVSGSGKAGFNDDCSATSVGSLTAGTTIYFRVTPSTGYRCSKVVVGGTEFSLINNGEGSQVYTFTQPEGNVGIDCYFEALSVSSTTYTSRDELIAGSTRVYEAGDIPNTVKIKLSDYVGKELEVFGWHASSSTIQKFGYKIDNNSIVYDSSFKITAEAIIHEIAVSQCGAGADASRFDIYVPITDSNAHTIKIYAKDATSEVLIWTINVEGEVTTSSSTPKATTKPTSSVTSAPTITAKSTASPTASPTVNPTASPAASSTASPSATENYTPVTTDEPALTETPIETVNNTPVATAEPLWTEAPLATEDIGATTKPTDASTEAHDITTKDTKNKLMLLIIGSAFLVCAGVVTAIFFVKKKK